ncbi:MAG: hypothetical protein E7448_00525 [Ruminococcaceae bacterium]|nr:hypothetical protein [Oscillospiraceae bacterium]
MSKKIRWITQTAVMLAALVALQAITKPLGQLVTGSCVNAVLAISALLVGMSSGIAVALISPIFAFLLGIAPNFVTVIPIMLSNTIFACLLCCLAGNNCASFLRQTAALITASVAKFALLYLLVVELICGILADALLGQKIGSVVVLAPPMLNMLPAMFSWPQLLTALIGGGVALFLRPILAKATQKR